jgi:hypothetical protein
MIDNIISTVYKCNHCTRTYKIKTNYTKHTLFCEIINKTPREREIENDADKLPSSRELYMILLEVTAKYAQLEKKVDELTKSANTKKRKINVIDWLNDNYTYNDCITFEKWVSSIKITRTHLELIFNSDYIHGNVEILKYLMLQLSNEHLPIKAFQQKENILFVCILDETQNKKWEIMDDTIFVTLMNTISKQIFSEFSKWQTENNHKMYEDDFSTKYSLNFQKILGCGVKNNHSQSELNSRIKRELYKHLKMNLKNIVEYEFGF